MRLDHETRTVVEQSGGAQTSRVEEEIDLAVGRGGGVTPMHCVFGLISAEQRAQGRGGIYAGHLGFITRLSTWVLVGPMSERHLLTASSEISSMPTTTSEVTNSTRPGKKGLP